MIQVGHLYLNACSLHTWQLATIFDHHLIEFLWFDPRSIDWSETKQRGWWVRHTGVDNNIIITIRFNFHTNIIHSITNFILKYSTFDKPKFSFLAKIAYWCHFLSTTHEIKFIFLISESKLSRLFEPRRTWSHIYKFFVSHEMKKGNQVDLGSTKTITTNTYISKLFIYVLKFTLF